MSDDDILFSGWLEDGPPGSMELTLEMVERMTEIAAAGGDVEAYLWNMAALKEAGDEKLRPH